MRAAICYLRGLVSHPGIWVACLGVHCLLVVGHPYSKHNE